MTTDPKRLADRLRARADENDRVVNHAPNGNAAFHREAADALDAQAALLREAAEVLTKLLNPPAPFSASAIEEQGAVKGHARNLLSRIEAVK